MKRSIVAAAVLLGGFSSVCPAQTASFQALGDLPGGTYESRPYAISNNGSTVVGGTSSAFGWQAFRWTEAEGMVGLGHLPGYEPGSVARDVSGDGSVIVGRSYRPGSGEAFRWTQADGMLGLGGAPSGYSAGHFVSDDGSTVVGFFGENTLGRWTQAEGWVSLGSELSIFDATADVSVIVGAIDIGILIGEHEAAYWTEETGTIPLGFLGEHSRSSAMGVSADGSILVGYSGGPYDGARAFRWTESEGMVSLGVLPGGRWSQAYAVSADGSIIVGRCLKADGERAAIIWDETHGMRNLQDVLITEYGLGPQLTGWDLRLAEDISADGTAIVGVAFNPSGDVEAWRVVIPEPSSAVLAVIACVGLLAWASRQRRRERGLSR